MVKNSKKTINNLKELLDRGGDCAGIQDIVDEIITEILREETPKILDWCIKGCLKYLEKNDLLLTTMQREWLQEYKTKMNVLAQFIMKECVLSEQSFVECKKLYNKYKKWAKVNEEYILRESKFASELKKKGITIEKNNITGKAYYVGVRIAGTFTIRNKGEM